jgi:CheY-like chemotaxis protein
MFICPDCHGSTVHVGCSLEVGSDATSQRNWLLAVSCTACNFTGAAASRERNKDAAAEHQGCRLQPPRYHALVDVINACPAPDDPACRCDSHTELGRVHGTSWPGLRVVGSTVEFSLQPSIPVRADVLIVDDDEDFRCTLAGLLEDSGYRVARARGGREALSYLRHNQPPGAMVLDLMMPGMSGLRLHQEVASTERLRGVHVVVCTSAGERHLDALGLSPRHVLRKLSLPELLARISSVLGPGSGSASRAP